MMLAVIFPEMGGGAQYTSASEGRGKYDIVALKMTDLVKEKGDKIKIEDNY
jgi:hypothetical protein